MFCCFHLYAQKNRLDIELHLYSLQSELSVIPDLGRHFKTDLGRPGYTESVCSFLLFLRNIKTHYDDE